MINMLALPLWYLPSPTCFPSPGGCSLQGQLSLAPLHVWMCWRKSSRMRPLREDDDARSQDRVSVWCQLCPGQLQLPAGGDMGTSGAQGEFQHPSRFVAVYYQWSLQGPCPVSGSLNELSHSHASLSHRRPPFWNTQWMSFGCLNALTEHRCCLVSTFNSHRWCCYAISQSVSFRTQHCFWMWFSPLPS